MTDKTIKNREMQHETVFDNGTCVIRLAAHAGFCFGVKSAVNHAFQAAEDSAFSEMKKYTWGPIIHNDDVVADLKERGVDVWDREGMPGEDAAVIIRSHGISEKTETELRRCAGAVIDATCPYVKKIHTLVAEAHGCGKQIIIVGDKDHPEVQGINGWCNDSAVIIRSGDEADALSAKPPLFVVAQTTLNQAVWEECKAKLLKRYPQAEVKNTICQATAQRQQACMSLAKQSDLMIIIGSQNSSNTRKLYEIAGRFCKNTFFVENHKHLPLKEVKKYNRIGVAAGASAPERIIKEVIAHMSEIITNEANEMFDLMAEIEKSLRMPQRGEIVKGEVIQVGSREVYVNLGCKKDGIIPKAEIALEPDQDIESLFKVGDEVEAKVLKTDDGEGNILLSRKKVEISEHWDEIIKAYEEKQLIEVRVVREVKGGVIAAYKEVSGFIPMSQLNDRYVEKADEFIGKNLTVKVTRVDQKRNKAVFSHKAVLTEEKNKRVAEIWAGLNVGDSIEGTVMRFTDYGAFVDIGGIDGLLHISEISWGKLKHPQEALEIGQKITVKILSMNEEKGKISLGLKQNTPEPWSVINEKYTVGQVVTGKVVQIKEYGAFVELEPGLDGLVHISEIAAKRVTNIADEISVGQTVSAKILEIDETKRRISLSIKETLDPEEAPAEAEDAE
ncbi:MAG: bifunctional 4-hydroxy-3-methylbut-2-enyl diphosphate reductase/30S ribosomal protein S1 [Anaerovoracaceae bacterium]